MNRFMHYDRYQHYLSPSVTNGVQKARKHFNFTSPHGNDKGWTEQRMGIT
ncbi:MAG: hypothetical protein HOP23_08430 [Methylococcaceae bacterium]|nr:hypothetical protein [Methylococcaceae bacterium]